MGIERNGQVRPAGLDPLCDVHGVGHAEGKDNCAALGEMGAEGKGRSHLEAMAGLQIAKPCSKHASLFFDHDAFGNASIILKAALPLSYPRGLGARRDFLSAATRTEKQ